MKKGLLLIILMCASITSADATQWYVRAGALGSNDGTDWTNAWETVDDIVWGGVGVARGDTVWFADGKYEPTVFSLATEGTKYVYLLHPNASAHGTSTGWNNAYGDGQALFDGGSEDILRFTTDYWWMDGLTRTDETSGHGFKILHDGPDNDNVHAVYIGSGADYLTLRYVELEGQGVGSTIGSNLVYTYSAGAVHENLTFQYCYLHDDSRGCFRLHHASYILIEYCYMSDLAGTGAAHGGGISSYFGATDITVRYCKAHNIEGSSAFFAMQDGDNPLGATNVSVYGNIIWYDSDYELIDAGASTVISFNISNEVGADNWKVYNNTIANITGLNSAVEVRSVKTDNNYAYNNLFYNCVKTTISGWAEHDYNVWINCNGLAWGSTASTHEVFTNTSDDQFIDWLDGDFRLSQNSIAIEAGVTKPWMASTDMNGNPYGNPRTVGAFAYTGGNTSTISPSISSVTINPTSGEITVGGTVTITVNAANNQTGLTASNATINTRSVPITEVGNGIYRGVYTVQASDPLGVNINATGITLTSSGGTSAPASSSGSSLKVVASIPQGDTTPPIIQGVVISPKTGYANAGDNITITVTAANNETGLTASNASINAQSIPISSIGNGIYRGVYTVQAGHAQGVNIEATGIRLTDAAGNQSTPGASTGSTLRIDTISPSITTVNLNPSTGDINPGQSVTITANAANFENGLTASNATFAGHSVPLSGIGGGAYRGTYTIQAGDQGSEFASGALFTDNFESGNTSNWDTIDPGVAAGSVGKYGDHGVQFAVQSTDAKRLIKDLGSDQTDLYTSFYFRLSPDFNLVDTGGLYINRIRNNSSSPAYATRLNIDGGVYSLSLAVGGWVTQVGEKMTIVPGQWYWVKVHYLSATNGVIDWWVNGNLAGHYSGNTSQMPSRYLDGIYFSGFDAGTTGTVYYDHFQVTTTDHVEPMVLDATGITLTDAAGNVSAQASSSGSSLRVVSGTPVVDTTPPVIQSVTISPSTGQITVGGTVTITATAANSENGLTASNATINTRTVALTGQGSGIYRGVYTVQAGDPLGNNINATGITLTDAAGNVSTTAASSGSTLQVVAPAQSGVPSIASVTLSPNSGYVKIGGTVQITVTASGNLAGLTPSTATINSKQIPLSDQGNGSYTGIYTVVAGDNDIVSAEATGITLTGSGGTSAPASSSGSTLRIDAHKPVIQSVVISPNTGTVAVGGTVTITASAANSEAGLTASNAIINGKSIPLSSLGNGIYRGTYSVLAGDNTQSNVEAAGIVLTDAAGNASTPGSSTGSTLMIDTGAPITSPGIPSIASVKIYPSTGYAKIGDTVSIIVTATGAQTGLTSSPATINGKQVPLIGLPNGTYTGTYTVVAGDNDAVNVEAQNVILSGSGGQSTPTSSSGSTLRIDANSPAISTVTISPNTGMVSPGDSVIISVNAMYGEPGLTPSAAMINGQSIPLAGTGNGLYRGVYVVSISDSSAVNVQATGITLRDAAGNISSAASSTGSTLMVDGGMPTISFVTIDPMRNWVSNGDSVKITVQAVNNRDNLIPSTASINGKSIPLQPVSTSGVKTPGVFQGWYIVSSSDEQGRHIEASNVTLRDSWGNSSQPSASTGSTLNVDTIRPGVKSVILTSNVQKIAGLGQSINIIVTAEENESGLITSNAEINGRMIPMLDAGDGTYRGIYIVSANDSRSYGIEAQNIVLTDLAGNSSDPASSSNSGLTIIPMEQPEVARSDFNNDGIVGFPDFTLFAAAYGYSEDSAKYNVVCDMDDDGEIGLIDFSIFAQHYNQSVTAKPALGVAKLANTVTMYTLSDYTYDMSLAMSEDRSVCTARINISNPSSLEGLHFVLNYNAEAVKLIDASVNDIPGLVIPAVGAGSLDVAAMFRGEAFSGIIDIDFNVENPDIEPGIILADAQVSVATGVFKIPESGGILADSQTIQDVSIQKVSESFLDISWTAPATEGSNPAAYFVEVCNACPECDIPSVINNFRLEITPGSPGSTETTRIEGLEPGSPYRITIRYANGNNIMSGKSNVTYTQTLAQFVDDDIDPSDPFIRRDSDDLFVSDNDDTLSFAWSSWSQLGVEEYLISVHNDETDQVVGTERVNTNKFDFIGESGSAYSVTITPLKQDGTPIGTITSRSILCPEAVIAPPGRPELIGSN